LNQLRQFEDQSPRRRPTGFDEVIDAIDEILAAFPIQWIAEERASSVSMKRLYLHLLRIVNMMRDNGQETVRFLRAFRDGERLRSVNSWRHVFYSRVLSSPDLVDFLEKAELPVV
jgi:hypothetical protein